MVPWPMWLQRRSIQNKLMICKNLPCKWIALPGDRTTQRWNYLSERICFLHKICKCDRKITLGTIIWMRVCEPISFPPHYVSHHSSFFTTLEQFIYRQTHTIYCTSHEELQTDPSLHRNSNPGWCTGPRAASKFLQGNLSMRCLSQSFIEIPTGKSLKA